MKGPMPRIGFILDSNPSPSLHPFHHHPTIPLDTNQAELRCLLNFSKDLQQLLPLPLTLLIYATLLLNIQYCLNISVFITSLYRSVGEVEDILSLPQLSLPINWVT